MKDAEDWMVPDTNDTPLALEILLTVDPCAAVDNIRRIFGLDDTSSEEDEGATEAKPAAGAEEGGAAEVGPLALEILKTVSPGAVVDNIRRVFGLDDTSSVENGGAADAEPEAEPDAQPAAGA